MTSGLYIVGALSAQIMAGVLAAVGFWWKERSRRRDLAIQHERLTSQVRDEIGVIEAWVTAHQLVDDGDSLVDVIAKARYDLDRVYGRLAQVPILAREEEPSPFSVPAAWAMAIFSFAVLIFPGVAAIFFVIRAQTKAKAGDVDAARKNYRLVKIMFWISVGIGVLFYIALLSQSGS